MFCSLAKFANISKFLQQFYFFITRVIQIMNKTVFCSVHLKQARSSVHPRSIPLYKEIELHPLLEISTLPFQILFPINVEFVPVCSFDPLNNRMLAWSVRDVQLDEQSFNTLSFTRNVKRTLQIGGFLLDFQINPKLSMD